MQIVVADTGPVNYLVQIEAIDLLPKLFEQVRAPQAVFDELNHQDTPPAVRTWITRAPDWLKIDSDPAIVADEANVNLDAGEQAAIALALAIGADLVLMDDRAGVLAARAMGLRVTGTLGILDLAARRRLIDLATAFTRLKMTGFYYRQGLLDALLADHRNMS